MTVHSVQRQDSPGPQDRCQWLLVSSPELAWQAGTGAKKANRAGHAGDHRPGASHAARGGEVHSGSDMRSCLSPWARASPWGNGSGLSGSANHEPPTPPSDLGPASPRPRTRPEPRLSSTRCPGGGERTQPSLGPCFPFFPSPTRSASGHRYSARREACGPLEAALTATMRPRTLRPAVTLPQQPPVPGASSKPKGRSSRGGAQGTASSARTAVRPIEMPE